MGASGMLESGIYDKDKVDIASVAKELFEAKLPEDIGAVVTFVGVTKRVGLDGKEVDRIEMESYEEHANKTIKNICRELEAKHSVSSVVIYHLVGRFKVGEPLVFVAVTARSRSQAIPALDEAIQRYKTEPALWKKEVYVDGTSRWISHA